MTTQITVEPPKAEVFVPAEVVADKYAMKARSILSMYRAGKIPGVRINSKTVRFSLSQVSAALGLEVKVEAAK